MKCPKCNEKMIYDDYEIEFINENELCMHEYLYCPNCPNYAVTAIRSSNYTKHGEKVEYNND